MNEHQKQRTETAGAGEGQIVRIDYDMEKTGMKNLMAMVVVALAVISCGRTPPPSPRALAQRVIVIDRADHLAAITNVVTDAQTIAAIEALFPSYETRPESETAAAYVAQYEFVFDLPNGSSIRVISDGNRELWSTGNGDFPVVGNLKKTIKQDEPPDERQ